MFGIDLDKLLLVGILVGMIVGPTRLREWRRAVPRVVGRMHALYQQGKSEVTRDLDDLAPEWREYDPRQLHPRRLLREIGADLRRATESDDVRAASHTPVGESAVESSPRSRDEKGGVQAARGVGDDIEDGRREKPEDEPEQQVNVTDEMAGREQDEGELREVETRSVDGDPRDGRAGSAA